MIFFPFELFLADLIPIDFKFASDVVLLALPILGYAPIGSGIPRLPVLLNDRWDEDTDRIFDDPAVN